MRVIAGKYQVLKELGEGGYGQVFLVEHVDLSVRYALKLLNRTFSEDANFTSRFKREAEILLKFSHPGSVQLRDFGKTDDGLYYMAMDYCDGILLYDVLRESGHFSILEALNVMEQILSVLDSAHSLGIVHRDIKPDNIMVVTDARGYRQIKILDFGIAKIKEQALSTTKTVEGVSIGTPQYMSPEQAAGERLLDNRVDLYSAGILFYELLCGDVPFRGETVIQTLLMHLTRPPQPFPAELKIPEYISSIVDKSLRKDKSQRYQSAIEFLEAVHAAKETYSHELKAAAESQASAEIENQSDPDSQPKTSILCLDDDEMVLNILKHILEREGYEVFTSTDCSSIHGYLFQSGVRLLISDVEMPGLAGNRVCEMLKSTLKNLKIVLFSNMPERELEKLSNESHADDFISKNARPDQWIAKIRKVLGEQSVSEG